MNKDTNARIAIKIRSRILDALANNYHTGFAVDHLGCNIESLKRHLESKFQPGMSWANQGRWHIDHIIPLSHFDLADRKELQKACHYTNLQPLWAWQNLKKNNKCMILINTITVRT